MVYPPLRRIGESCLCAVTWPKSASVMIPGVDSGSAGMLRTVLVFVAAALLTGAATVAPVAARSNAPLGYQLMCLKTPAECKGGGKAAVEGSAKTMAVIEKVNASVNRSIAPRNDGAVDDWSVSATTGDCEDYVLAKRRALIKAGFSPSALRIAYVMTRQGEGHAILVVKTTRGDVVLDNLNQKVRPLSQSGYRIVSMSGANPRDWS
jgi:predicted transglutaminase-like cysteine proteinase